MSQEKISKTRRSFLKTATYTAALSVGGISSLALAANKTLDFTEASDNAAHINKEGITIIQETQLHKEKVILINHSAKLQMLDARQPISLHHQNGHLVVSVNQNDADAINGMLVMSPNECITFDVKAPRSDLSGLPSASPSLLHDSDLSVANAIAEKQLQIESEHSVFNRMIPVQLA